MVEFTMLSSNIVNFLKGFRGMGDLVLSVTNDSISASGTIERAYFITKALPFREGESASDVGEIPIGQLEAFKSLLSGCSSAGETPVKITLGDDDLIVVLGDIASFSLPPIASASSLAGVDTLKGYIDDSRNDNWKTFGSNEYDFTMTFGAKEFYHLRNTGKAIQQGALFAINTNEDVEMTLIVQRDKIRVEGSLNPTSRSDNSEPQTVWFGKWLMDALMAMPSKGAITVMGGQNTPLVLYHTDSEVSGWETICVVAPRQEEAEGV